MNRRIVSFLAAAASVAALAGAAVAIGNSVSTAPAPAYVRSVSPAGVDRPDGRPAPATPPPTLQGSGDNPAASEPGDDRATPDQSEATDLTAPHDVLDDHGDSTGGGSGPGGGSGIGGHGGGDG